MKRYNTIKNEILAASQNANLNWEGITIVFDLGQFGTATYNYAFNGYYPDDIFCKAIYAKYKDIATDCDMIQYSMQINVM